MRRRSLKPVMGFFNHLHNGHNQYSPMASSSLLFNPLKRYMRGGGGDGDGERKAKEFMEERALSTEETMKRIEEEEEEEERENSGIGSQTVDKARDAVEEAILGESPTPESVKEQYKKASSSEDNRQTGDTSHSTI